MWGGVVWVGGRVRGVVIMDHRRAGQTGLSGWPKGMLSCLGRGQGSMLAILPSIHAPPPHACTHAHTNTPAYLPTCVPPTHSLLFSQPACLARCSNTHIEEEINRLRAELLRKDQDNERMQLQLAAEKEERERAQVGGWVIVGMLVAALGLAGLPGDVFICAGLVVLCSKRQPHLLQMNPTCPS